MNSILKRLRDMLWPPKPDRSLAKSQFVIYDDMFEDFEILPASAADWCASQMTQIDAFAAQHQAPDGMGWTDIYMRPAAPKRVQDLAISYAAASDVLAQRLTEFDEAIATGMNEPRWQRISGRAFGSQHSAVVVYHDDAGRTVRYIAVSLRGDSAEITSVLTAVAAIPSPEPLMVANWAQGRTARLDRPAEVENYLAARV